VARRRGLIGVVGLALAALAVAWWWRTSGPDASPAVASPVDSARGGELPSRAAGPGASPRAALAADASRPVPSAVAEEEEVTLPGRGDGGPRDELERAAAQLDLGQWLKTNADAAEKNVDFFCQESKRLEQTVASAPTRRTRDAATYLAVRVDWEDGSEGLLRLPDSLSQKIRNLPQGTWPTALDERDWAGLDFGWMQELLAYDFWSLSAEGPLRNPDVISFYDAPIPNFISLMSWAKLRLARGLRVQDLPQASLEVRHLADLIGSTGNLVGEMIRLAVLRFDRLAWEVSGQPVPESTLSPDDYQLALRVDHSSIYFLFPGVPKAVREKALGCSPVKCTMLMEGLGAHVALRDFVPDAQEGTDWLMAQHPCDPALAAKALRGEPSSLDTLLKLYDGPGAERIVPPADGGG